MKDESIYQVFKKPRNDACYYYLKDHLGSIHMTLDENRSVKSAQDYRPFGKLLRSYDNSDPNGKYKFTEKERDSETNYDYFGARYNNNDLGVWLQVDPLADKYPGWSPYNYVMGNPLVYYDPDGMRIYMQAEEEAERTRDAMNELHDGADFQIAQDEETGYYYLVIGDNSSYDWNQDGYSRALFETINTTEVNMGIVFSDVYGSTEQGQFDNSYQLSSKGLMTNEFSKLGCTSFAVLSKDYLANPHLLREAAGTAMHELIGHGHYVTMFIKVGGEFDNATWVDVRNQTGRKGFQSGHWGFSNSKAWSGKWNWEIIENAVPNNMKNPIRKIRRMINK